MNEWLQRVYWGNTVLDYLVALGSMMLAGILVSLLRGRVMKILHRWTSRTKNKYDDLVVDIATRFIIPYAYLAVNYSIISQLQLPPKVVRILEVAMLVITVWYVVRLINAIVHGVMLAYMKHRNETDMRIRQLTGVLLIVKLVIWIVGIVLLIDNLGYNVTTIIAGLGVGGIAIALAAQNILSDLFSYLVIFFDKPFEVGDYIVVGNNSGVVEKIGVKTSHVRSLDGQQLVMPNAEMVKTVIHNHKRLERRRVVFSIGVVYNTEPEKLRQVPDIIRSIIKKHKQTTFDRAHFKSFGEFSINYEIVYYVESADYLVYMDTHHAVCLEIIEQFRDQEIRFALPTQTLFINSDETGHQPAGYR